MSSRHKRVGFTWPASGDPTQHVLPSRFILRLQQTIGNQAIVRMMVAEQVAKPVVPAVTTTPVPLRAGHETGLRGLWRRLRGEKPPAMKADAIL